MVLGSAGEIRYWAEVDGVPCVWAHAEGPLQACLVFGVGRADESLRTAGITHAVEHLALHKRIGFRGRWNGVVGMSSTRFFIEGEPDDIVGFFRDLSRDLVDLDVTRLPDELRVLQVEAARHDDQSQQGADLLVRFGARGPGLVALPEYGLHRLGADEVAEWASTRFTRANAAPWMTGPPPAAAAAGPTRRARPRFDHARGRTGFRAYLGREP